MALKEKNIRDRVFDIGNITFLSLILFIMIYPIWFTIIVSVSEPIDVAAGSVWFIPSGFTLEAYQNILKNPIIWTGYKNTIFYTALGTLFNLFLTIPSAYVLSKKYLQGRSFLSWYFLITMYFSGGLVPTYLLVKDLGLVNNRFTLIVLGGLSVYNVIVTRMFFQTSIPEELYESARIDGASHFRMFFQIALPLAKPILAVMALFYGVGRWNEYFTAMVYTTSAKLAPLQLVLRRILILNENLKVEMAQGQYGADDVKNMLRQSYLAYSMKYALIFIASAPLLIVYPFVQKFFVKGVMIGSLKG